MTPRADRPRVLLSWPVLVRRFAVVLALSCVALTGATSPRGCDGAVPVAVVGAEEPDGLLAHWPFDEAAGDRAADVTPTRLDAVISEAAWTGGPLGVALEFPGRGSARAGGEAGIPSVIRELDQGTIALWLRVDDIVNGDRVPFSLPVFHLGPPDGSAGDFHVTIYVGHGALADPEARQVFFTVNAGEGPPVLCFDTTESLALGEWYHYAVVVAPGDHRVYLNGREVPRHYNAGTTAADHAFFHDVLPLPNDLVAIGYGGLAGQRFSHFNGAIDEVRLYGRALSAAEIEALAQP